MYLFFILLAADPLMGFWGAKMETEGGLNLYSPAVHSIPWNMEHPLSGKFCQKLSDTVVRVIWHLWFNIFVSHLLDAFKNMFYF